MALVPNGDRADAGERAFDIFSRLLKERIIFLRRSSRTSWQPRHRADALPRGEDPDKDIYLYINSPGGSVTGHGHLRHDAVREAGHLDDLHGPAAVDGALLLCAGKGKRFALRHARIMIHQRWAACRARPRHRHPGKESENARGAQPHLVHTPARAWRRSRRTRIGTFS